MDSIKPLEFALAGTLYKRFVLWRAEFLLALSNSYLGLLSFILGTTIPAFQSQLFPLVPLSLMLVLSLLMTIWKRPFLFLLLLNVGLLLATYRFGAHLETQFPPRWERKEIQLVGEVIGMPKKQDQDISFQFRVRNQVLPLDLEHLIGEKLQLACYRCPLDIVTTQQWKFTVRLKRPHGYSSAGAFDYEKYLFRNKIVAKGYVRLKSENIKLRNASANLAQYRIGVKNRLLASLKSESAGFNIIVALSIGDKSSFSSKQRRILQDSGLSHLIAISGLHIGLVFICCFGLTGLVLNRTPILFESCPKLYLCLICALVCAFGYSALAGFAVSTQRALVMLLLFSIAKVGVRDTSLLKVLLIAAVVILLYDPFSILDIGFWLSCGAVVVIHFSARNGEKVSLLKLQPMLWLGMAPLTVHFFGKLSLMSPVLNLFAVPLFCLLLIPLTLFAVLLNEIGLTVIAKPALHFLDVVYVKIFILLDFLVSHSFASISLPTVSWWTILVLMLLVMTYRFKSRWRWWFLVLYPVLLFFPAAAATEKHTLKIALLDVGQGLAMVIQSSEGVTVFDTGPRYSSGFTAANAVLVPYLRSEGIRKVDRLIISHADNDHIGGLQALRQSIFVKKTLTSRTDKIPSASECLAGQTWSEGMTSFLFISPNKGTPKGSNNRSCVLRIQHGSISFLITADIEKQVERFLLSQGQTLESTIMLVPHQGSKTSSTPEFIEIVNPKLVLVAAGYLNHYGHPHKDVIERYNHKGIPVLSTIDSGTIEIEIDEHGYVVEEHRVVQKRFWHWRNNTNENI